MDNRRTEPFRRHTLVWKPPARTLPSAHSRLDNRRTEPFRRHTLVWLQTQRILRFRSETKYRRLQTAAEVFCPAVGSPRGYRKRKRANIPVDARKRVTARVQGKDSREYTRGRVEKSHRAGTGEDFARIYPWKRRKTPPRGYRERFPADIPVKARKRVAARVQGKNSRGYTSGSAEKSCRAGTGKEFPRIYPWKRRKESPRGYRKRFPADIPVNMRSLLPRELY